MGLDRIVSEIQGDMSNYGTEVFTPHFDPTHNGSGVQPYVRKLDSESARIQRPYPLPYH